VKTKMQLVLGKNILEMNELTENDYLPNFELKFTKFEETTHTQKYEKTLLTFERVAIVYALARLTKNGKRLVLLRWL